MRFVKLRSEHVSMMCINEISSRFVISQNFVSKLSKYHDNNTHSPYCEFNQKIFRTESIFWWLKMITEIAVGNSRVANQNDTFSSSDGKHIFWWRKTQGRHVVVDMLENNDKQFYSTKQLINPIKSINGGYLSRK